MKDIIKTGWLFFLLGAFLIAFGMFFRGTVIKQITDLLGNMFFFEGTVCFYKSQGVKWYLLAALVFVIAAFIKVVHLIKLLFEMA